MSCTNTQTDYVGKSLQSIPVSSAQTAREGDASAHSLLVFLLCTYCMLILHMRSAADRGEAPADYDGERSRLSSSQFTWSHPQGQSQDHHHDRRHRLW